MDISPHFLHFTFKTRPRSRPFQTVSSSVLFSLFISNTFFLPLSTHSLTTAYLFPPLQTVTFSSPWFNLISMTVCQNSSFKAKLKTFIPCFIATAWRSFVRGDLQGTGWDKKSCLVETEPIQKVCPISELSNLWKNHKMLAKSDLIWWFFLLHFIKFINLYLFSSNLDDFLICFSFCIVYKRTITSLVSGLHYGCHDNHFVFVETEVTLKLLELCHCASELTGSDWEPEKKL